MTYLDTLRTVAAEKQTELVRIEADWPPAAPICASSTTGSKPPNSGGGDEPECSDPVIVIRRLIREAGRPLYIDDILRGLDRPLNREGREEIRQLLLSWVRREEIFTRPRPGIFGLVELEREFR